MVKNSDERKEEVFLSLGSNLGDRMLNLKQALSLIEDRIGTLKKQSSYYETAAWGKKDLLPFLNMVVEIETNFSPKQLLKECLLIEKELGRERTTVGVYKNRSMDIDIIYYGAEVIDLAELKVPHPLMQNRAFVLAPLVEIDPIRFHPSLKKTNKQLLNELEDQSGVKRHHPPF